MSETEHLDNLIRQDYEQHKAETKGNDVRATEEQLVQRVVVGEIFDRRGLFPPLSVQILAHGAKAEIAALGLSEACVADLRAKVANAAKSKVDDFVFAMAGIDRGWE